MGRSVGDKRTRTQARLIEAAYEEVLEKGFAAASLDAIARRAGMTKGAIYSNYRNKAELLLAVREAKQPRVRLRFETGATFERQVEILAQSVIEDLPRSAAGVRFVADYHRYATADADFQKVLAQQYARMFSRGAEFFAAYADELTVSPREFGVMIQVLMLGLFNQFLLTPEEVTPQFIESAVQALGRGVKKRPAP